MERNIISAVVGLVFVAIMAGLVFATAYHVEHCPKKTAWDIRINGDTGRAELYEVQVCK